ncbi:unnamed protein product [Ixodes pacificus]
MVLVLLGTLADTAFLLLVDRELSSRDLPKLQSFDIMSQNSYVETLRCFSAYRNFRLLMSGRHPSKTLRPLVGISSMSFLWVVIGNTLVLRPYNLSANLKSLREYLNDPMIQFALNSSLAVDAIATALGITITYNIVQLVKRCDGFEKCSALTYIKCTLNAMKYFFAGLLPMYMILLLVINAKFPSAGTGPTWTIESQRYLSQCEGSWMWNPFCSFGNHVCFELIRSACHTRGSWRSCFKPCSSALRWVSFLSGFPSSPWQDWASS